MSMSFAGAGTAKTRFDFTKHHAQGAAQFAQEVERIATERQREGLGNYWVQAFPFAVGAVMLSAAMVEAYVNSVLEDYRPKADPQRLQEADKFGQFERHTKDVLAVAGSRARARGARQLGAR